MPCRDYYDDHPKQYFKDTIEGLKQQVSFAESALCRTLAALEHVDSLVETSSPKQGDFYNWINFAEAGIAKQDLVNWHQCHKILDQKHREEQRIMELREAALAKLTPEERKVLGVK
jgi:hypothetical protein